MQSLSSHITFLLSEQALNQKKTQISDKPKVHTNFQFQALPSQREFKFAIFIKWL